MTVICTAFDVTEPDVAVMFAVPEATPVTTPVLETVATDGALDAQVNAMPLSVLPFVSSAVASSDNVPCTATDDDGALTVMVVNTGTVAVTVIVRTFDVACPDVAVMSAVPAATPVMSPLLETVATAELLVAHVTAAPLSVWPPASRTTAAACVVAPTAIDDAGALIATDAAAPTAEFTTVSANAGDVTDPAAAAMFAVPGLTPVTTPLPSTVATEGSLVLHVNVALATVSPAALSATACNGSVPEGATCAGPAAITVIDVGLAPTPFLGVGATSVAPAGLAATADCGRQDCGQQDTIRTNHSTDAHSLPLNDPASVNASLGPFRIDGVGRARRPCPYAR